MESCGVNPLRPGKGNRSGSRPKLDGEGGAIGSGVQADIGCDSDRSLPAWLLAMVADPSKQQGADLKVAISSGLSFDGDPEC